MINHLSVPTAACHLAEQILDIASLQCQLFSIRPTHCWDVLLILWRSQAPLSVIPEMQKYLWTPVPTLIWGYLLKGIKLSCFHGPFGLWQEEAKVAPPPLLPTALRSTSIRQIRGHFKLRGEDTCAQNSMISQSLWEFVSQIHRT